MASSEASTGRCQHLPAVSARPAQQLRGMKPQHTGCRTRTSSPRRVRSTAVAEAGLDVSPKPPSTASLSFGHSAVNIGSSPFLVRYPSLHLAAHWASGLCGARSTAARCGSLSLRMEMTSRGCMGILLALESLCHSPWPNGMAAQIIESGLAQAALQMVCGVRVRLKPRQEYSPLQRPTEADGRHCSY